MTTATMREQLQRVICRTERMIVATLLALIGGVATTAAQSQREILVVDSATGEPLPFATVTTLRLDDGSGDSSTSGMADVEGRLSLPHVPGRLAVTVRHVGYRTSYDTLRANDGAVVRLAEEGVMIGQVIVTRQGRPISASRSIHAVRVIDRAEIDAHAAQNMRDLMAGELNVRVDHDNILGSSLAIGGVSGRQVKILVDGVPLVGRIGDAVDLTQLLLADVERVEIVEGPLSVVYGTDAMGGVVNIITRRSSALGYSGELALHHESAGAWNADAALGLRLGSLSLRFTGGRHYFSGYAEADTGRVATWKPREQTAFGAAASIRIGAVTLDYNGDYLGQYILSRGTPRAPYGETALDDAFGTLRLSNKFIGAYRLAGGGVEATLAHSLFHHTSTTSLKNLVTLESHPIPDGADTSTAQAWSARIAYAVSRPDDARMPTGWQVGIEGSVETASGNRIDEGERSVGEYALFATAGIRPFPELTLQPGVRWIHNTRYSAPIVPSLNLRLALSGEMVLRASWGRGFRAPSLRDLFFRFVDINHDIHGNSSLRAETSHNLQLGATWSRQSEEHLGEATLQMFLNDIADMIALVSLDNSLYTYANVGRYRTAGLTAYGSYRTRDLTLRLGVGFVGQDAMLEKVDGFDAVSPEMTAALSLRLPVEIDVSLRYKYTGPLSSFALRDDAVIERRVDGYHMLDLSVRRAFLGDRLELAIGGKNLLDVTDIAATGGSLGAHGSDQGSNPIAWGRTFHIDARITLHAMPERDRDTTTE